MTPLPRLRSMHVSGDAGSGAHRRAGRLGPAMGALLLSVAALCASGPAWAGKKVALIIGNANYQNEKPLKNPVSDARLIAKVLKSDMAFDEVELVEDASIAKLDAVITAFGQKAKGADSAIFYFSGHGVQDDGKRNYLIPVDAKIENTQNLKRKALAADDVVSVLADAQPKITLIILDACRDNPFLSATRGIGDGGGKGLARVPDSALTEGMLIAYATREGQTAQDGKGDNSPFATALAAHIKEREPVLKIFDRIAESVRKETAEKQRPIRYGDLPVSAYILPPLVSDEQKAALGAERAAWEIIGQSDDINQIRSFLIKYPEGALREAAQAKLDTLLAAAKLAWGKVAGSDDPNRVREFIKQFGNSEWANAATARLGQIEDAHCKRMQTKPVETDATSYLDLFANGRCVAVAEQVRRGFAEDRYWQRASASGLQGIREYLALYENGRFRDVAFSMLKQLTASEVAATAPPAPGAVAAPAPDPNQADKLLWDSVKQIKTASAYKHYLGQYPAGLFAQEANTQIAALQAEESKAWQGIESSGNVQRIRAYINDNPTSPHLGSAREALTRVEEQVWQRIRSNRDEADFERYFRNFPNGRYVADVQTVARDVAEEKLWQQVESGGQAALAQYVSLYPSGKYAGRARSRLQEMAQSIMDAQPKPSKPVALPAAF